ncbi:MAG: biotin/lipoyl-containing protein [Bacteroidota bacterium]
MKKYLITIDDTAFEMHSSEAEELDVIAQGNAQYHVIADQKAYQTEILKENGKNLIIKINGNHYSVVISDSYDQMVKEMGLLSASTQKLNEVVAPMPGLIMNLKVSPGQSIVKDDQLLVLSAMKMENIILAAGEGIVKSINVKEGDAVEKGQVIIEME